ncbi:hypothetical protein HK405_004950, partial [Cladochytrium tenue]
MCPQSTSSAALAGPTATDTPPADAVAAPADAAADPAISTVAADRRGDVLRSTEDFAATFRADARALKDQIADAVTKSDGGNANAPDLAALRRSVIDLERRLADAAALFLPAYDQRQCTLQIQELNDTIAKATRPPPKFSFKSSRAARTSLQAARPNGPTTIPPITNSLASSSSQRRPALVLPPSALILRDAAAGHWPATSAPGTTPSDKQGSDAYLLNLTDFVVDLGLVRAVGAVHIRGLNNYLPPTLSTTHTAAESLSLPELTEDVLRAAGLDMAARNRWSEVEDFGWLRRSAASPNWRAIERWGVPPCCILRGVTSGADPGHPPGSAFAGLATEPTNGETTAGGLRVLVE